MQILILLNRLLIGKVEMETFVSLELVEFVAELFAAGVRGRGVKLSSVGPELWLFGEQSIIPWLLKG